MSTSAQSIPSGLSLRANFSWTFVGNVVYAGCQWGMLVVLAKLGSPEMVGQFALGLAITAPVMMFASLQMRTVQATDAKREYAFGDYLGLRLITTLLALLVIAGIVAVSGYRREVALIVLAVGLSKAFESISDVFYGLQQQQERMDRIATSMMLRGIVSLLALSVGVYVTGSVFWGAMGVVVTWALMLLGYDLPNGVQTLRAISNADALSADSTSANGDDQEAAVRPRWRVKTLLRLAWLALPLGFVMMLVSLNSNVPRYFVERYLGEAQLGIFAALTYFHRSGVIVTNALGASTSPRLSRYYAAGNRRAFRKLLFKLAGVGLLLAGGAVLVALVAGRQLMTLFYRSEYARQDVFVPVMVAAGMAYVASFFLTGLTAARYFRVQTLLYAVMTGVLVLVSVLLVPSDGLRGAATALIVARLVQLGGSVALVAYVLLRLGQRKSLRGEAKEKARG